ncbi:MAG: PilZ domain-containing protein [Roseibium sp.]
MNTNPKPQSTGKSIQAQVIDLSDMSCFEATAYKLADDGCWIVSEKVDQLKEEIGLRLPGYDKLVRGTVVAFGDNEAQISFSAKVQAPQERRGEKRQRVLISAIVSCPQSALTMKCKIVDASKSGCRLESEKIARLPQELEISIPGLDVPMTGNIVWRSANQAGVKFSWPLQPQSSGAESESIGAVRSGKSGQRKPRKRVSAFGD